MKTRIAILCGGQSVEHEVSLRSARNVVDAMDRSRYHLTVIGIDRQGVWRRFPSSDFLLHADDPRNVSLQSNGVPVSLIATAQGPRLLDLQSGRSEGIDVLFPVLHGTFGEDGAIQGYARMVNCPCVGCDVASSANCMDKEIAKSLLQRAGLPVARSVTVERHAPLPAAAAVVSQLGLPLFVKPARLGSSVGITKVKSVDALPEALRLALRFDSKVLIEEFVAGREIECSVLGTHAPRASVPGEIVPRDEWYSYDAKYVLDNGARLVAPASLPPVASAAIQSTSVRAFQALGCSGMARVDFFMRADDSLVINELNTIPGFTNISMYPKLWQLSGISYPELITHLVDYAMETHAEQAALSIECSA